MRPTVYVDTTVPSYYVDQRESLRLHIDRTRQWWDRERGEYQLYVSDLVVLELQEGDYPGKQEALGLVGLGCFRSTACARAGDRRDRASVPCPAPDARARYA